LNAMTNLPVLAEKRCEGILYSAKKLF